MASSKKKGIFDEKDQISRRELRSKLRRASSTIPGTGKRLSQKDRVELEKEVFGKKYGGYISKREFRRALDEMRSKAYKAPTTKEKRRIRRRIKFLRKVTNI